ncbi:MAG: SOS response-associated peptidase [Planctomycetota bacterium]
MCGRTTHLYTWREIYDHLARFLDALDPAMADLDGPAPAYNVPPKAHVPVLRRLNETVAASTMQWWLVPHWSRSPDSTYPTFNARSETAHQKPAFRGPFRDRRCVLPVSGFYEWAKLPGGGKQPYYITRADGAPLLFAGLWDAWGDPTIGPPLESCTVLTTNANEQMLAVHDRMPCVLEPEQIEGWLSSQRTHDDDIKSDLRPAANGVLQMHEVDARVGNVRNTGPELIRRLA